MSASVIRPQAGPQTLFCSSSADVCFFASMPGSGKSWALCLELLRWNHLSGYTGVGMRAHHRDLVRGPSSLFGTLRGMGERLGGRARQAPHPGIEFRGGDASILLLHGNTALTTFDGLEISLLGLDEAPHFDLETFQYISASRMRTTCGIRPYVRCTTMPTADSWVHDLCRPWLDQEGYPKEEESGKIRWFFYGDNGVPRIFDNEEDAVESARAEADGLRPRSLSFVFARTQSNIALMRADPTYIDRLGALGAVERKRLLDQCWEARPDSSGMFDRTWFEVREHPPNPKDLTMSARGWDLAATKPSGENSNPNWSRGVRLDILRNRQVNISDVVSLRDRPGPVNELIAATVQLDGPNVMQCFSRDPGAAGVRDEDSIRAALANVRGCGPVYFQPAGNKVTQAKAWSSYASARMSGTGPGFSVTRAAWNGVLLSELESFPDPKDKANDDIVDAISYAWREVQPKILSTGIGAGLHHLLQASARG